MKYMSIIALTAIVAALSSAAFAQEDLSVEIKAAHAPSCPACKMTLSAKKSDKTPVGIAVGKKVLYCCSGCDMKGWKKDKKGNLIPPAPKK